MVLSWFTQYVRRTSKTWIASGISNHRWIVGCKLCLTINHLGQIIGWAWAPANAHDSWFHPIIEAFKDTSVILADTGFHAKEGDPENMKVCRRGQWNCRMLIETVNSMLTVVCHTKKCDTKPPTIFKRILVLWWLLLIPWLNGLVFFLKKMALCQYL